MGSFTNLVKIQRMKLAHTLEIDCILTCKTITVVFTLRSLKINLRLRVRFLLDHPVFKYKNFIFLQDLKLKLSVFCSYISLGHFNLSPEARIYPHFKAPTPSAYEITACYTNTR